MKFQPIFIFLAILLIDASNGMKKLSVDENKERLETCGTENYDKNKNEVISWGRGGGNGEVESSATLISKHHILTSTKLVTKWTLNGTKWIHDGSKFEAESLCSSEKTVSIPVPEEALQRLNFKWTSTDCQDNSCRNSIPITWAYFFCNKETLPSANTFSFPMIVGIEKSVKLVTFCLPTKNDEWPLTEIHTHYQYNRSTQEVFTNDITIKGGYKESPEFFYTKPYEEKGDRSGPLIAVKQGQNPKYYLIGIGVYGGNGKANDTAWFYRAKWFTQGFCDWFGICHEAPEEPKPEPTTEPPPDPTTEEPTTEKPTTEEPTTEEPATVEILIKGPEIDEPTTKKPSIPVEPEKPTNSPVSMTTSEIHEPPTRKESPSPEPTMEPIPVIDLDQEYKEFKEREAEDDRGDWDEWGNDFYRSADFFENSGRRSELFVGFLMVIMVVRRMVLR